jgi:hypothetical protein
MAPTYTITSADVAAVSGDSALVAGVEFDWGSTPRKIKPPASVSLVNAQWIVDHCRFAEAVSVGMGRPPILTAAGKVQTGTNPITGNPELTSITPSLQLDWVIETQKSSGVFIIEDVYNPTYTAANGTPPYINVSGVDIRYVVTRNSTIQQIAAGDTGGFTSSDRTTLNATATAVSSLNNLSAEQAEAAALAAIIAFDPLTADGIGTIEANIGLLLDASYGDYTVDATANTGTIFKLDGTIGKVFDLFDENDAPASQGVYKRVGRD